MDFSFAPSSSIIRFGELDLLSWTFCLATGLFDFDELLDLDFLLLGLALLDLDLERLFASRLPALDLGLWDLDFGLCDLDFGLWDLDFGLCDLDLGLWVCDLGLCDPDLGLCGLDFGLADLDFTLPDRDRALPDPDLDLLEPLLDLDVRFLGLPDAWDFGLDEPDLLLWADPDLCEPTGDLDLLREALDDFLECAVWFDLGDSLPDLAGLRETDLNTNIIH